MTTRDTTPYRVENLVALPFQITERLLHPDEARALALQLIKLANAIEGTNGQD